MNTKIGAVALAPVMLVAAPAESKNMFYLLTAKWCEPKGAGPMQFEITEDGSLIYDPSAGRVCQITRANNMDRPSGTYGVTWGCEDGVNKERLVTSVEHDRQGNRHFMLKRNG